MLRKNEMMRLTLALMLSVAIAGVAMGQSTRAQLQDPVIDLSFAGGTVQQYVDAIKKQAGDVNILLDEESKAVLIPAVTLTSVNLPSAIELMDDRMSVEGQSLVKLNVRTINPTDPNGRPIYYVRAETGRTSSRTMSTVISVKDILDGGYKADDVMTAVATTIELLAGSAGKAEIRFHQQTGLLIAKGDGEQISAIHQVIDQIRDSISRNEQGHTAELDAQRYYQQTLEMKDQLNARASEVNSVIQQMTEARTRAELFQKELDNMRRAVEQREEQLVQSQLQIRMLQDQIAKMEKEKRGNS